jgi:hypothetical protein
MRIATLKVLVQFTEDGYNPEYEATFDDDALEDGTGQALLVYNDDRQWELRTPEEEVDRRGVDVGFHGSLPDTGLADAVRWARQQLRDAGYEVAFKFHAEDQD